MPNGDVIQKIFLLILVAVIDGVIVACSRIVEAPMQGVSSDGGFLSGEPCSAPCFSSIIPGETNFDQVRMSLSKNGDDLSCNTSIDLDSRKVMSCKNGIWIGAAAQTNLVDYISIRVDNSVKLDQVFEKYGSPDTIAVMLTSLPDYSDNAATLFYDTLQKTITLETSIKSPYPVTASSIVAEAEYFDKATFNQRHDDYDPGEWKGFGNYNLTGY